MIQSDICPRNDRCYVSLEYEFMETSQHKRWSNHMPIPSVKPWARSLIFYDTKFRVMTPQKCSLPCGHSCTFLYQNSEVWF